MIIKFKKTSSVIILYAVLFVLVISISIIYKNIHNNKENIYRTYIVHQGETLWTIGQQYCGDADVRIWIEDVRDKNKIYDPGALQPGKIIKLPDWRE